MNYRENGRENIQNTHLTRRWNTGCIRNSNNSIATTPPNNPIKNGQ
jgi:hypothetical protein